MEREMTNGEIIFKGGTGTAASLSAFWISHVGQINQTLKTVSLVLGIVIGGITLWKLIRKNSKP